jgi:hypothetical protein
MPKVSKAFLMIHDMTYMTPQKYECEHENTRIDKHNATLYNVQYKYISDTSLDMYTLPNIYR